MNWRNVKLGELLTESRIPCDNPNPDRRIKVRLKVLGVEKRGLENEIEGATKQFIRKAGQFIYGKQNFHKGAFGIIPKELDGFESSADLPAFDVSKECLPEWLFYFFKCGNHYLELKKIARGVATKRIHPEQIFDLEIPLPNLKTQKAILKNILSLEINGTEISDELTHQQDLVKQLRQAFLREAMQGKLVKQEKHDGNAIELLEKIKEDKARNNKKVKPLPPIKEEEIPFAIPENWVWCRLGDVTKSISTGPFGTMLHKSDYVSNGIPLVNPMNIVNGRIVASKKMMVNEKTKLRLKSYILKAGDVVIGRRGEMGRCAVVTEDENGWICGTGSFFLKLHINIYRPFFIKILSSDFAKRILLGASVGATMNNLNHRILNNLPIPLPPLPEQNRIVKKLEQLMQLCDELQISIQNSQQQNEMLLQQVLREALQKN